MIKTTAMLIDELKDYRAPAHKISRLVEQGVLFPVVRGLYETDQNTPGHLLAASIYGPSYLSFEFALSYWQLIPEAVYSYTSATFDTKKKKQYNTLFGVFTYRDVPKTAYPLGIQIVNEGDYTFFIANAEKAICDRLYTLSPVTSLHGLESLIFQDLRIDQNILSDLEPQKMATYAQHYRTSNHKLLIKWLRSKK